MINLILKIIRMNSLFIQLHLLMFYCFFLCEGNICSEKIVAEVYKDHSFCKKKTNKNTVISWLLFIFRQIKLPGNTCFYCMDITKNLNLKRSNIYLCDSSYDLCFIFHMSSIITFYTWIILRQEKSNSVFRCVSYFLFVFLSYLQMLHCLVQMLAANFLPIERLHLWD